MRGEEGLGWSLEEPQHSGNRQEEQRSGLGGETVVNVDRLTASRLFCPSLFLILVF